MKDHNNVFPIEKMCKALRVSRSGYYKWLDRKPSKRAVEDKNFTELITEIHKQSKQRYGSPKIAKQLKNQGHNISRPRVARIMKRNKIRSIVNKKFKVQTTDSDHDFKTCKNLLNREFDVEKKNKVWVSDITYIPTRQGWLYLTIVMDLFDRKIIGWALSKDMTAKRTTVAALKMALINNQIKPGELMFHSDRGVQYACDEFTNELKTYKIKQSMSRKGNCWDNAVAENFFKIIKSEMVNHVSFFSIEIAKKEIFEFIEIWYNRLRIHSKLNYNTPENYSNQKINIAA